MSRSLRFNSKTFTGLIPVKLQFKKNSKYKSRSVAEAMERRRRSVAEALERRRQDDNVKCKIFFKIRNSKSEIMAKIQTSLVQSTKLKVKS